MLSQVAITRPMPTSNADIPTQTDARGAASRPRRSLLLGLVLIVAAYTAGLPSLDAPWIQGDERLYIVGNPDVTGEGRSEPAPVRWLSLFTKTHGDLYQPIPILSYAIEWALWQDSPLHHRRIDVLLHGLNGLLLWRVMTALLAVYSAPVGRQHSLIAWSLALVWTLHPMQAATYAADMGRTHLLSATFALLSLKLHLAAVQRADPRRFAGACVLLILAMLCKPVVGWFILILALEWSLLGRRAALRSYRVWLVAGLCALFAGLTFATTRESGMLEDTELAIFGDPLSRSFLSVWFYFRNLVAPLWLSTWYLPDENTSWLYPSTWAGVGLTAATFAACAAAARHESYRGTAVGLAWFWALLLPLIGVVGARVAAANDRYVYQALMGLALAAGVVLSKWIKSAPRTENRRTWVVMAAAIVVGVFMLPWTAVLCANHRTAIRRAQRVVDLYPQNPRAWQFLAVAYAYSANRPTPERDQFGPQALRDESGASMQRAIELAASGAHFFPSDHNRASFHRAHALWYWGRGEAATVTGRVEEARAAYLKSLEQADAAYTYEPDAPATWTRLAHAYRALKRWDDALTAYQRLERIMPADAPDRALRFTEHGMLLLRQFGRPSDARQKFRRALEADSTLTAAAIGLAQTEIRAGLGEEGYKLIRQVLKQEPHNIDALLVEGEYHLRSHHWPQAGRLYESILKLDPTHYKALLGYHEVCAHTGKWQLAAYAWDAAVRHSDANPPRKYAYQSFLVWAAACNGDAEALQWADRLLEEDPLARFPCLAHMLFELRQKRIERAIFWARRACDGEEIPKARSLARGAATLRIMRESGELLSEAAITEAVLLAADGRPEQARAILDAYLAANANADAGWRRLAEDIRAQLPVAPDSAPRPSDP